MSENDPFPPGTWDADPNAPWNGGDWDEGECEGEGDGCQDGDDAAWYFGEEEG